MPYTPAYLLRQGDYLPLQLVSYKRQYHYGGVVTEIVDFSFQYGGRFLAIAAGYSPLLVPPHLQLEVEGDLREILSREYSPFEPGEYAGFDLNTAEVELRTALAGEPWALHERDMLTLLSGLRPSYEGRAWIWQ